MSQRPRYYHALADNLTLTAPFNCTIEVEIQYSNQWGYNGQTVTVGVTDGGLATVYEVRDRLSEGNTIGRTLRCKRVLSGAKKGKSYTFQLAYDGGSLGGSEYEIATTAKCIPV